MNTKIEFPALNISNPDWEFLTDALMIDDEFYFPRNNKNFDKYLKNQHFVDVNGNCFKIIGVEETKKGLRYFVSFFSNTIKRKMFFTSINRQMNFKEVKEYYLKRMDSLQKFEHFKDWRSQVENSYNLKSLLKL